MPWIFLGVIAIALVVLSMHYPKLAFALLIALITAGVVLYRINVNESHRSTSLISVDEIELLKPTMEPAYAGSYNLNARLVNNHATATLVGATLATKMEDCDEQKVSCVVIGETSTHIDVLVPPRQARDFSKNLYFNHAVVKDSVRWTHGVTQTRAQ